MRVRTQARDGEHDAYVENVVFKHARVVFATVHVVGSNNDLEPWAELPGGDRPTERLAEFRAGQAAALDWIDDASTAPSVPTPRPANEDRMQVQSEPDVYLVRSLRRAAGPNDDRLRRWFHVRQFGSR